MFAQWWRDELVLSFIFVQRLVFVGKDAASIRHRCEKYKRYAQCNGTVTALRTLAHLLATHFRTTPKQANKPRIPTSNKKNRDTGPDRIKEKLKKWSIYIYKLSTNYNT